MSLLQADALPNQQDRRFINQIGLQGGWMLTPCRTSAEISIRLAVEVLIHAVAKRLHQAETRRPGLPKGAFDGPLYVCFL